MVDRHIMEAIMPLINEYNEKNMRYTHIITLIDKKENKEYAVMLEFSGRWDIKILGEIEKKIEIERVILR